MAVNDSQITTWALSFTTCGQLINSLEKMTEKESPKATHHEKGSVKRIDVDRNDRESSKKSLSLTVDPLEPDQHPAGKLMNIVTDEVTNTDVNAQGALNIKNIT